MNEWNRNDLLELTDEPAILTYSFCCCCFCWCCVKNVFGIAFAVSLELKDIALSLSTFHTATTSLQCA